MRGQAMVEYIVILVALSAALISAGNGSIGFSKNDNGSLVQALHNRYTEQAYAISISESPEFNDLNKLAEYYESLDKYPSLRGHLNTAGNTMTQLTNGLASVDQGLNNLETFADPSGALDLIHPDAITDEVRNQFIDAFQ
jgi:Flp pilus assembly pilin Flp